MCNNCGNGTCKGCGGKCTISKIAKVLIVIGAINWGLVGLGMLLGKGDAWNLVRMILGSMPALEAIVYVLVGVAGIASMFGCKCKTCMTCQAGPMQTNA